MQTEVIQSINRLGGAVLRRLSLRLPESMPPVIRSGHHGNVVLPELKPLIHWPSIDIVTVFYNGERHVEAFLKTIRELRYPKDRIHLFLIDNGSTDDTLKLLRQKVGDLPHTIVAVGTNTGFTGGCNIALRACQNDYVLLLNPDARIAPDSLAVLVMRAAQERGVGIVEAAQRPVEHPKWFDQKTLETPWCSGAVSLIWRRALLRTGVFDERLFMYCEDVDLSWRMWSKGYRCVYEPRAIVWHGQGTKSHKGGEREYYLGFRNGLMLRFMYGGLREYLRYAGKMLRVVFLQSDHSLTGKRLLLRALVAHLRNLPHLIRRRREQAAVPSHRWIQFFGWDYHIRRW